MAANVLFLLNEIQKLKQLCVHISHNIWRVWSVV